MRFFKKRKRYQVCVTFSNTGEINRTRVELSGITRSYKKVRKCFESMRTNYIYSIPDNVIRSDNDLKQYIDIDNERQFLLYINNDYPEYFLNVVIKEVENL